MTPSIPLTAKDILDTLHKRYVNNCKFITNNAFIFDSLWESDFFHQARSWFTTEFEVKISRSDFHKDKTKIKKHLIIETWKYQCPEKWEVEHKCRPNRFYYVVPADLVTVDEIPKYAWLIYMRGSRMTIIKKAPLLHSEKLNLDKRLCLKFYFAWLAARHTIKNHEYELKKAQFKR